MPRKEHNVSRQRSDRFTITINGLLTCRARLLRAGRKQERDADEIRADIAAIDHVLVNVFDYREDIEAVTRDFKREAIFKRGELFRVVCDILRKADRPLTTREITEIAYASKGRVMNPGRQSKEWINRVRHVCKRIPESVLRKGVDEHGSVIWVLIG